MATTLYQAEAASIFRQFIESGKVQELIDETQKVGLVVALSIPAKDYLDAFRLRAQMLPDLGKMFEKYDAWVAPSRNAPPPRVDTEFNAPPPRPAGERPPERPPQQQPPRETKNVIGASNIAGLPALSVPCGFTREKNLPVGIQFVADALREDVCIEFAAAYQAVTDWHKRRPNL